MIARLLAWLRDFAAHERRTWRENFARAELAAARQELHELEGRYATERLILDADHLAARDIVLRRITELESSLAEVPREATQ